MVIDISGNDLLAYSKAARCPLSEARFVLVDMEPELRDRVLIASRLAVAFDRIDDLLTDPIEQYPVLRRKIKKAGKKAESLILDGRGYNDGVCHSIWGEQKRILKEVGIIWYTPAEMNPNVLFD